jgi:hypothetical protein
LYKHSDGYAEGVLPSVLPFVATFMKFRGDDPEYLAARLLQHLMNVADGRSEQRRKDFPAVFKDEVPDLIGYGVDTAVHRDIEFLYTVKKGGAVLVEAMRYGKKKGTKIAEFPVGTSPDAAIAEIKRLQEAEEE